MTDILMPPFMTVATSKLRYLDGTGASPPGLYTGARRTTALGNSDRLGMQLDATKVGGGSTTVERRALGRFLFALRGKQNRAYLFDSAYRQGGSFPSAELLTNNTFDNGTTGWSPQAATIAVNDRVLRLRSNGTFANQPGVSQSPTLSQYTPYVGRSFITAGSYSATGQIGNFFQDNGNTAAGGGSNYLPGTYGYFAKTIVPEAAGSGAFYPAVMGQSTGFLMNDFVDVPWCSVSRCALVDAGANALVRSDEFDNASWTKNQTTVDANVFTAPDGTVTGDRIRETTVNSSHFLSQSVTKSAIIQDWCICGAFRIGDQANARSFVILELSDPSGTNACVAGFNISAGTVVSTSNVGANTNARAFISSMGNGWWYCALVGSVTSAVTSLRAIGALSQNGSTLTYTGVTDGDIGAWRATLAQSSVPVQLVQTTTTAIASGASPAGTTMVVKGLPVSTNGLLLPFDQFEVITSRGSELKIVDRSMDSDGVGRGTLKFHPPLRGTLSDNAPIIINKPLMRAICISPIEIGSEPGVFSDASFEFEESPSS